MVDVILDDLTALLCLLIVLLLDIVLLFLDKCLPHTCNDLLTTLSVIIYLRKKIKLVNEKKSSNHRFRNNRKQ